MGCCQCVHDKSEQDFDGAEHVLHKKEKSPMNMDILSYDRMTRRRRRRIFENQETSYLNQHIQESEQYADLMKELLISYNDHSIFRSDRKLNQHRSLLQQSHFTEICDKLSQNNYYL
eukprot:57784_1